MNNLKYLVVLGLTSASSLALADHGRGGADSVRGCFSNDTTAFFGQLADLVTGPHLRTIEKIPVGSLYDEALKDSNRPIEESLRLERLVLKTAFRFMHQKWAQEASEVETALASLSFKATDNLQKLDTGLRLSFLELFAHCRRKQIADQDFDTRTVFYDSSIVDLEYSSDKVLTSYFGPLSKAFLRVHEGYIRLGFLRGWKLKASETFARDRVGQIANSPEFASALIQTIYLEGFSFNYAEILSAAQHSQTSGFTWSRGPTPTKELKVYSQMLKTLGLPCSENQTAADEIRRMDRSFNWGDARSARRAEYERAIAKFCE